MSKCDVPADALIDHRSLHWVAVAGAVRGTVNVVGPNAAVPSGPAMFDDDKNVAPLYQSTITNDPEAIEFSCVSVTINAWIADAVMPVMNGVVKSAVPAAVVVRRITFVAP